MNFSEKLQELRKKEGYSQEELAERMNVSRQAVSRWESGQGYPEMEKIIFISELFHVSIDYLLKEDPAEMQTDDVDNRYYVSREMAEGYLAQQKAGGRKVALGVALCIVSTVPAMLLNEPFDTFFLFAFVIAGIIMFLSFAFQPDHYDEIEKRPILLDESFRREFQVRYQRIRQKAGMAIATGIGFCITGVAVQVLFEYYLPEHEKKLGAVLMLFVAVGVALMVMAGFALSSSTIIAKNQEHIATQKDEDRFGWIYGMIFLFATIVFLLLGFLRGAWASAAVIYPVAGLLSGVVGIVTSAITKNNKGN